jgi:putative transposase
VHILHATAQKTGAEVHHIDRFFPSTKLCHVCGTLNAGITLRDRVWSCQCGVTHQRDLNAARNIYREAQGAAPTAFLTLRETLLF